MAVREERFRVVPIARDERIAQDIDGAQHYRQRSDTVIQEVEIVAETPFESEAGSTVIPKSDDVQQADYQVENPPQEEEVGTQSFWHPPQVTEVRSFFKYSSSFLKQNINSSKSIFLSCLQTFLIALLKCSTQMLF